MNYHGGTQLWDDISNGRIIMKGRLVCFIYTKCPTNIKKPFIFKFERLLSPLTGQFITTIHFQLIVKMSLENYYLQSLTSVRAKSEIGVELMSNPQLIISIIWRLAGGKYNLTKFCFHLDCALRVHQVIDNSV